MGKISVLGSCLLSKPAGLRPKVGLTLMWMFHSTFLASLPKSHYIDQSGSGRKWNSQKLDPTKVWNLLDHPVFCISKHSSWSSLSFQLGFYNCWCRNSIEFAPRSLLGASCLRLPLAFTGPFTTARGTGTKRPPWNVWLESLKSASSA